MNTISFVIPVYNEEKRLDKTFKALDELVLPTGLKLQEIIFVDDGSTDKTAHILKNYIIHNKNHKKIKLFGYHQNQGKGFAVRQGMTYSSADYTVFFDADISTPLSEMKKFVEDIKKGTDVIIGTRKNGHSTVIQHQPVIRELLGKGFTLLTQSILQTDVTDFTCGFKAFSKQAKQLIFPQTKINRWSYDAELIFLAKQLGFSLHEVPVTWSNDNRSRVKLYKDIPITLCELLIIVWIHRSVSNSVFSINPFYYKSISPDSA